VIGTVGFRSDVPVKQVRVFHNDQAPDRAISDSAVSARAMLAGPAAAVNRTVSTVLVHTVESNQLPMDGVGILARRPQGASCRKAEKAKVSPIMGFSQGLAIASVQPSVTVSLRIVLPCRPKPAADLA
jgi:hypothetical protein